MDPISALAIGTAAVKAAKELFELAVSVRNRLKQDGELTPQQEAEFDAQLQQVTSQAHWQPTPPPS